MTYDKNQDFKAIFQSSLSELLTAQTDLSALVAKIAADPWLETQQQDERIRLTEQRDAHLEKWSRLALSWMLRGGRFDMVDPQGNTHTLRTTKPSPPQPAPAPKAEPMVQTLRRSQPDPEPRLHQWRSPTTTINPIDAETLRDLLDLLHEPMELNVLEDVRQELEYLLQGTAAQALSEWTTFPKSVQKSLVGHVVARSRHIQDELNPDIVPPDVSHDLDRIFSNMTAFSKREQPGFVFGLMRHHHPISHNWLSDAKRYWQDLILQLPEDIRPDPEGALEELREIIAEGADEEEIIDQALAALEDGLDGADPRLVRLMLPHKDLLGKHTQFKKLRKAIREHDEE